MYSLEVIKIGEKEINSVFDQLGEGLIEKSKKDIAQALNDRFKLNINKEVDASLTAFKPLSDKTKNKKGRGGDSSKILQDKGFLIGGMLYKVSSSSIRFYNTTDYAKYHQEGFGKLPKRTIFPEKDEKYVIDLINKVLLYNLSKIK